MSAFDVYDGQKRIGRVEVKGRKALAFVVDDREGSLRPVGAFASVKAAKDAILQREARHAA